MTDKILALLSLLLLAGFVGIVVVYVAEPDLAIIAIAVLLMAAYDFWDSLRKGGGGSSS